MANPVDGHFRMVDEQKSIQRMKEAIQVLRDAGIEFTVEGGWAVAAYGSNVPSVDLDVLMPGGLTAEVAQAIENATGLQFYSRSAQDKLALDFVDADRPNALINRPQLTYTPSAFLVEGTEVRTVIDGIDARVPRPAQLVFMKLKAFHDRLIQWKAARGERYRLASMTEGDRERTVQLGEAHWLRKAGKDLFDASFLLRDYTTLDDVKQIAPAQMWAEILPCLTNIPLPIRRFAEDMVRRASTGDVPILGGS